MAVAVQRRLHVVATVCSSAVIVLAVLVAIGSALDVPQLQSIYPAIALLGLGLALLFAGRAMRSAQAATQASESEAMLRIAGRVARLGGWTIDLPDRTLTWSDENCAIHDVAPGYKPTLEEGIGYFPSEYRDDVIRYVEACARDGTPYDFELPKFTATGRRIWVRSIGEAVRDADGRIIRLQGAFQDISERKRAEDALRQTQDELHQSQKMESVGRLAGGIAHDFNNLLTVINGYSESALANPHLDAETRALIEEIARAGGRAAVLTRQFLAFGRRQMLRPQVVDLTALVMAKAVMLREILGEAVTLTVSPASAAPVLVLADPKQLEDVVVSLTLNGRDAMPGGGGIAIVTDRRTLEKGMPGRSAAAPASVAVLTVTDTGQGITEPLHEIFEPYFTTRDVGKGSGLGLASVYGIVKQSGGFVEVDSEPGRGTRFTIYLPLADPPPDTEGPPELSKMNRRSIRSIAMVSLAALTLALSSPEQRGGRRFGVGPEIGDARAVQYDGRFVIVRLWYERYPGWSYDYPDMEQNLTLILNELTALRAHPDGSNILRMDDPELLKYPIAYLSEPGYWYPSDSEALGLRSYLAKGGFIIVDDFHFEQEWRVFEAAMRKVLPDARIDRLDRAHPVFNSFFSIKSLEVPYPGRLGESGLMGEFYGIHEGNDPSNRLMVVINYNMDIGDYMEHSGRGWYAVDPTNEAFKFGVNYFIYGLTH